MTNDSGAQVVSGIVYVATNRLNGKRYVGQTFQRRNLDSDVLLASRRRRHERQSRTTKRYPFHCALGSVGFGNFIWEVVACSRDTNYISELETTLIREWNTLAGNNGYNGAEIGISNLFSVETRKKMAESALARWRNMSEMDRQQLTTNQTVARESIPGVKERQRRDVLVLHSSAVIAKRSIGIKKALNSYGYRNYKAKETKERWASMKPDVRVRIIAAMRAGRWARYRAPHANQLSFEQALIDATGPVSA